ncbi:MAG: DUF4143 domain-containing protein [Bifidobacteriaceae bacterium]|jgi:predicted AAA+ superfamily ATPase|nr:DUF4143 domain-containing protein [Bifidobacteriaceae bacterium]
MDEALRRPIADTLLAQRSAKVLILEGARGVGKTTAVRQQLVTGAGFSYATLADPATLSLAAADPTAWLTTQHLPIVIDEAQLLPSLPLAVKEHVDQLGRGTKIVLTGSASIGRKGLGGADPLTRRTLRFTMWPITARERSGTTSSVVDALFDGDPSAARFRPASDAELLTAMRTGGFPDYVLDNPAPTASEMRAHVRADVTSLLTDTVLPDTDYSALTARTLLAALACNPGGIFNASKLAQATDLNRRTVDRYMGIFQRLFLLHPLPNLASRPVAQSHARAKVHPVDTSLAVVALERAGRDVLAERELFGAVFESYVAGQILAAAQWADTSVEAYYWREPGSTPREVDLVLVDDIGRTVAVEVKGSREYNRRELAGLLAFRQAHGFHRAYLIHPGSECQQLDRDIWLLPVGALTGPWPSER